jgi:hypothetical protein
MFCLSNLGIIIKDNGTNTSETVLPRPLMVSSILYVQIHDNINNPYRRMGNNNPNSNLNFFDIKRKCKTETQKKTPNKILLGANPIIPNESIKPITIEKNSCLKTIFFKLF